MPGVENKSIDITLENNQLTIEGSVSPQTHNDYQPVYSEYETGDYYRAFTLNDMIDRDKIEASYKNGVLRLTLPKSEKTKARQISLSNNVSSIHAEGTGSTAKNQKHSDSNFIIMNAIWYTCPLYLGMCTVLLYKRKIG